MMTFNLFFTSGSWVLMLAEWTCQILKYYEPTCQAVFLSNPGRDEP